MGVTTRAARMVEFERVKTVTGDAKMKRVPLSLPELAIISLTRGIGGVGVGLLLSCKIKREKRTALGWTLLGVGIATTVPIVVQLVNSFRRAASSDETDDAGGQQEKETEPLRDGDETANPEEQGEKESGSSAGTGGRFGDDDSRGSSSEE